MKAWVLLLPALIACGGDGQRTVNLTKDQVKKLPPAFPPAFSAKVDTSALDGTTSVRLELEEVKPTSKAHPPMTLSLSCRAGEGRVIVMTWNQASSEDTRSVRWKVDERSIVTEDWKTAGGGALFDYSPRETLSAIFIGKKLLIEAAITKESTEFDLTPIAAYRAFFESCVR